jgi:geranylgeranyl reductase family protein
MQADVLIIGAGPAGSAAALALARQGRDVVLADRADFPRDKVCGDALIPDALKALARLGIKDEVLRGAFVANELRLYAPDGTMAPLAVPAACVRRQDFDDRLRAAAVAAGARFLAPLRLAAAVERDGVVRGAQFVTPGGSTVEIRAPVTLLATGANAQPLQACGVAERTKASAIAARAYFDAPPPVAREWRALAISFDAAICPGYGWVFPGPDGIFNVGAGFFYDARTPPPTRNVRVLWRRFVDRFAPARELVAASRQCGPLKGTPLRTALTGASLSRPGLMVVGEAAGLTYSLSGEGIGKAMESALLAADVIADAACADAAALARAYADRIRAAFAARFRAYTRAQVWLERRWLANLIARRAARGGFVRRELEAMLNETGDPDALFSWPGLLRIVWPG